MIEGAYGVFNSEVNSVQRRVVGQSRVRFAVRVESRRAVCYTTILSSLAALTTTKRLARHQVFHRRGSLLLPEVYNLLSISGVLIQVHCLRVLGRVVQIDVTAAEIAWGNRVDEAVDVTTRDVHFGGTDLVITKHHIRCVVQPANVALRFSVTMSEHTFLYIIIAEPADLTTA